VFAGRLVDTKGRRKVIIAGIIIFAAASFGFSLFPFKTALPLLRLIQGAGYSIAATALSVAITDVIPKKRMGEGIGYFGLSNSVATAIRPAIALMLISDNSFKMVFHAAASSLMVGGLLTLFCNYERKSNRSQSVQKLEDEKTLTKIDSSAAKINKLWIYFEKTAIPFTIISLFSTIAMSATTFFLVLYTRSEAIANAGLFFTLSAAFMVAARLFAGKIADKFHPLYSLIPGLLFRF